MDVLRQSQSLKSVSHRIAAMTPIEPVFKIIEEMNHRKGVDCVLPGNVINMSVSAVASTIESAGKNNFTLIAFLFYLAANAVSIAMKKEKTGTKLTLVISLLAVVGIISFRLIDSHRQPETNQTVTVQGDGNGTAVGTGNSVTVDHIKPPETSKAK
jgi:hypothetical protein